MYSIPGFHDPVSSLTHLLGAVIFAVMSVLLLLRRGWKHPLHKVCLGVYAFSCVFLLAMSGVMHQLSQGVARAVMLRLDHAAIFVLIAGNCKPIHGILLRSFSRWGQLLLF